MININIAKAKKRHGLILIHTGGGKGKSSAAFGMVFRAAGWDMRVCVIQFIKGKWQTGEQRAAQCFANIEWHSMGDGFTWNTKNPMQDMQTTKEIWLLCQEKIRSGSYDLVVLDEILYCCGYGWLDVEEIALFLQQEKPAWMHVVLTGNMGKPIPDVLLSVADTVTEMRKCKHAFDTGIMAEKGVEF
ncbi:MAG: cob(I)yrinic acid a,c-diamide adenosyltransferase [Mariprofundales bacterium]